MDGTAPRPSLCEGCSPASEVPRRSWMVAERAARTAHYEVGGVRAASSLICRNTLVSGTTVIVKVAHVRLCHSRMLFARAYWRETQEMVFDALDPKWPIKEADIVGVRVGPIPDSRTAAKCDLLTSICDG